MLHEQIEAHHRNPFGADGGINPQLIPLRLLVQAEGRGNGRTGDVRVQHAHLLPHRRRRAGQGGRHSAFANAAFAADHGNHLADVRQGIGWRT